MLTITYHLVTGRKITQVDLDSTEDQTDKAKEIQRKLDEDEWIAVREGTSGASTLIRSIEISRIEVRS